MITAFVKNEAYIVWEWKKEAIFAQHNKNRLK